MPQQETPSLQRFLDPGPTGEMCPERLTRQASKSLFEFEIWIQEEQTGSVLCPAAPDVSPPTLPTPLRWAAAFERPPASMRSGRVAMLTNSGCLHVSIAEAGVHRSFDFVSLIQTEGGGELHLFSRLQHSPPPHLLGPGAYLRFEGEDASASIRRDADKSGGGGGAQGMTKWRRTSERREEERALIGRKAEIKGAKARLLFPLITFINLRLLQRLVTSTDAAETLQDGRKR